MTAPIPKTPLLKSERAAAALGMRAAPVPGSVAMPAVPTHVVANGWPKFVHLRVHSAYSLLESALPISKIAKLAVAGSHPAVALTDTNNLFGVLEFSDKLASAGVQPIAGLTVAVDFQDRDAPTGSTKAQLTRSVANAPAAEPAGRVALLAMNEAGYQNLMKLTTDAFFRPGDTDQPHVSIADVERCADGLILLTGGPDGPIDRALAEGQDDLAACRLQRLSASFGDRLYVEIQRHGLATEIEVEPKLLDLAYAREIAIVATNQCVFATPDDHEAHDVLLCIAGGRYVTEDDRRKMTPEHGFKSADDMVARFADLPEALAATVEIAERCAFRPRGKKPILPTYVKAEVGASTEDKLAAEAAELKRQAEAGLDARLAVLPMAPGFTRADYDRRLAFEIGVIASMKFPGYFLIVADFIKWSKSNGVAVGPGRGSGAGSLVAWSLTITDLDPLRFGLLFERFLNPERVSMPDFDIDFCQEKRDRVIHYVQQKYGADRVAQIITHGKLQARAVLRDVGRVLQIPYGQVDKLCKLVPNNPANPVTLPQAIEAEPKLAEERDGDPVVARLLEIAIKLEGLYRHASTHAAGIVIGDRPLVELVPLYRDPKSSFPITQFNWKLVEAAGLVKFDFLGLKTLTVLEKALELIKNGRGITLDLATLHLEDPKAYQLLAKADTVGVFQLESTGMRESLKRLKPDRFEDIIAMVALYRPGPMDNIPTYINRKHGEEEVDCLHPMLEGILKETYGVIIYQEQVIQIAQVMGGYTLGQADLLRRAMGKKDKNEMAQQQARFVEGAVAQGVKAKQAADIFMLVDKFAGYGFNKSHAAAYALISYHTAYLKANFREEFLAASMTLDMAHTDKLAMFSGEARRAGIRVTPPDINRSGVDFAVEPPADDKPGAIIYSLAALKNIGAGAVEAIVTARTATAPFTDLSDFARRLPPKVLNKRGVETLASAGAFDTLEPNRALVKANSDTVIALGQRLDANAAQGIDDLFAGGGSSGGTAAAKVDLKPAKVWTPMERLEHEFQAVGFYLSGHPLDSYQAALKALGVKRFVEFEADTARGIMHGRVAAIVVSARERRSAKGNKFAFAMFSDQTGQFEAVVFSDTLNACGHLLVAGTAVLVSVEAERDGDTVKMRVQGLESLDKAAAALQRGWRIVLDGRSIKRRPAALEELKAALSGGGSGEILLEMQLFEKGRALTLPLPGKFDVSPGIRDRLMALDGVLDVLDV